MSEMDSVIRLGFGSNHSYRQGVFRKGTGTAHTVDRPGLGMLAQNVMSRERPSGSYTTMYRVRTLGRIHTSHRSPRSLRRLLLYMVQSGTTVYIRAMGMQFDVNSFN